LRGRLLSESERLGWRTSFPYTGIANDEWAQDPAYMRSVDLWSPHCTPPMGIASRRAISHAKEPGSRTSGAPTLEPPGMPRDFRCCIVSHAHRLSSATWATWSSPLSVEPAERAQNGGTGLTHNTGGVAPYYCREFKMTPSFAFT
jgi:hypothetical protein